LEEERKTSFLKKIKMTQVFHFPKFKESFTSEDSKKYSPGKTLFLRQYNLKLFGNEKSNSNESRMFYPVPKGDSPYATAKKAEYIEKNLQKAEEFYRIAVNEGDRAESAIKDLAGVIHQQGKTLEAIQVLKENKHLFAADFTKYENLLANLKRQVVQKGNRLNRLLKLSPLPLGSSVDSVLKLFGNSKRVSDVELYDEGKNFYAILKFATHSAARKTLESFSAWERFKVEWVSITGDCAGNANKKRGDGKKDRVLFVYKVFQKDPESRALVLPLDCDPVSASFQVSHSQTRLLIGTSLMMIIEGDE
jgi:hypothetical protein